MRLLFGFLLFVGVVALLGPMMKKAALMEDLSVDLEGPIRVFEPNRGPETVVGRIGPRRLHQRVRVDLDRRAMAMEVDRDGRFALPLSSLGPGLHFLRWNVTYGRSRSRNVALAYLEGPFHSSEESSCNLRLVVAQELLEEMTVVLRDAILNRMNQWLAEARQPQAQDLVLSLKIVDGGIALNGDVRFGVYGSFTVATIVGFAPRGANLGLSRHGAFRYQPDPAFRSYLRTEGGRRGAREAARRVRLEGERIGEAIGSVLGEKPGELLAAAGRWLGGWIGESKPVQDWGRGQGAEMAEAYAEAILRNVVDDHVIPGLDATLSLPDPWILEMDPIPLAARFQYCAVKSRDRLLAVDFHVRIHDEAPADNHDVLGAVQVGGELPMVGPGEGHNVALLISPDVVNNALYALWRRGQIHRWLASPQLTERLKSSLRNLDLTVSGLDAALPPVLQPSSEHPRRHLELRGAFRGLLSPLSSQRPPRDARIYVAAAMQGFQEAGEPTTAVSVAPREILITCQEADPDGSIRLYPCLSDVLQVIDVERMGGFLDSIATLEERLRKMIQGIELGGGAVPAKTTITQLEIGGVAANPPVFRLGGHLRVETGGY